MIFGREPAVILALVQAGLALAIGFGLQWTGEQVALVMAFAVAVVTVITRQSVTPLADPRLPVGTSVNHGHATVVATDQPNA